MQTHFSVAQLANPDLREADKILRACVHCGFCTATCPTYVLLGDELDSPRGRIYLIKDMLENDRAATLPVVKHIDRCLSCLSCMTTCPSGVHYMHLVDHARDHIEATYRRPLADRLLRALLATVLPRPRLFRFALIGGKLGQPLARWMPRRLAALAAMLPRRVPSPSSVDAPQTFPAEGARRKRVTLLSGCAQQVLAPEINEATIRLLTRHGCDVVVAQGRGLLRRPRSSHGPAGARFRQGQYRRLDPRPRRGRPRCDRHQHRGCGVTVKDYGYMLREDKDYAAKAARISALAKDVAEIMTELGLRPSVAGAGGRVAYHAACSLQHGQTLCREPQALLGAAGFTVLEVPEGHLCCGSAGTYNMLQPTIAAELQLRKVASIESTRPELIAAGNIGCIEQIARATAIPVLHTVELLDWATGGPKPEKLSQ